jgi:predicted sugar kinase
MVLAIPEGRPGPTGAAEQGLIEALPVNEAQTAALCRLLLLGVLPALRQKDLAAFGEALGEYNARAGELFAPSQGGTYASAAVADLVAFLTMRGVSGVGQSSWGPCVFAVADAERANWLVTRLAGRAQAWVTTGRNEPAEIAILEE